MANLTHLISRSLKHSHKLAGIASEMRMYHNKNYDVAIVGGGIIGMATAHELIHRRPNLKMIVVEKETKLACHQSSNNSGVIHAGIYYEPGSLKAKLCVEGLQLLYEYCDKYRVPYNKVGKLIVATSNEEVKELQHIYEKGKENNVPDISLVAGNDIRQIEPYCQGMAALHSPNTGIINYGAVTEMLGDVFQGCGGVIATSYEVEDFGIDETVQDEKGLTYPVKVMGKGKPPIICRYLVTCAGLHSDKLAMLTGCSEEPKIVPFRGDYLMLKPEKSYLVRGNIYPVPNPAFPFLGVHFTPRLDGTVWLGPNAVLAFKREGYNLTDFSFNDTVESFKNRNLRRLLRKHWRFALNELKDGFSKGAMVEKLQKFIPELMVDDVMRGPSGVRGQVVDVSGNLIDDFMFDVGTGNLGQRCLHVRNAPSPAATSSLAIAKMVVDKLEMQFAL